MAKLCACGEPLHYTDPTIEGQVTKLVEDLGETVSIRLGARRWAVPRHYIALHGILGSELPKLALKYGWLEENVQQ
jgi:hypothetical protein